jgi:hypothetical protein
MLSACLIVRDEIASLGTCLDSLTGAVDETVIVDTGSTDGTRELARQRATRFGEFPWVDDFAAARNAALDLARSEWVLVIDADEQLVGDPARIRQAIAKPRALAYQIESRSDLGNGTTGSGFTTRLFRRLPEVRYTRRVHEHVGDGIAQLMGRDPSWQVGRLEGVMLAHAGYLPAVAPAKGARNARLLERELIDTPDDYYAHYKLFQARNASEHLLRAAELLVAMPEAALRRAGAADEILTGAALAYFDAGDLARAEAAARAALVLGRHPATLVILGRTLLAKRELSEARTLLAEVRAPRPHEFHVDPFAIERMARIVSVELELASGDAARALQDGFAWFEQHPTDAVCLSLCADAAEALGHHQDASAWRAMAARMR